MQRKPRRFFLIVIAFAVFVLPAVVSAAGGFTDVADTNVFKADIDWLAASGVTKGCNPPTNDKFCPGGTVTREQMAAFMHRLAVNKVVDAKTATNADNADKLGGKTAAELAPRASFDRVDGSTAGLNGSLATVTITAPARGILLVDSTANFRRFASGTDNLACWIYLDGTEINGNAVSLTVDGDGADAGACAPTTATVVAAGTYTVTLEILSVDASTYVYDRTLWAMWVPFDGAGNTP